jgi:hypothetical protein
MCARTGPWFTDVRLEPTECDAPTAGVRCYTLDATISGGDGVASGECRIHALTDDGTTELVDGAHIDGISVRSGDTPNFTLTLPNVSDPRFSRWQPSCLAGPEG